MALAQLFLALYSQAFQHRYGFPPVAVHCRAPVSTRQCITVLPHVTVCWFVSMLTVHYSLTLTILTLLQFTEGQLLLFLSAHRDQVISVHEDGGVTATSVQYNASWALDRTDQEYLPLNSNFTYYNTGSNVNVYIVDTVGCHMLL